MPANFLEVALKRTGFTVHEWLLHAKHDAQELDDILSLAAGLLSRALSDILDSITS